MTLPRGKHRRSVNSSSNKTTTTTSTTTTTTTTSPTTHHHTKKKKKTQVSFTIPSDTATSLRLKASMSKLKDMGTLTKGFEQRVKQEIKSSTSNYHRSSHGFERRRNLSSSARKVLHSWLVEHKLKPYPTDEEKQHLAERAEVTVEQVGTWMVNARVRTLPKLLGLVPVKKKQKSS